MTTLKALHVASFIGNIGDNAMHDGAYRARDEDMALNWAYDQLEIREYIHWQTLNFDESFADRANSYDVVVFGGDSLLQTWRNDTPTGTYLDCAPDLFDRISAPIWFYGIGVDATRGVDPIAMDRCRVFLDRTLARKDRKFSVRDDGSIDLVRAHLGETYADQMGVISDGGLFARPASWTHPELPDGTERLLAVNLAGDMPEKRFALATPGEDGTRHFCSVIASLLTDLMAKDEKLGCIFIPHIHSDLAIISQTMAELDDRQRRHRVSVAPYAQGANWSANFDIYAKADAVLAMRFHANLVPLGLGVPVIGLDTHHKIGGLYRALGLEERCLSLDSPDLANRLTGLITEDLAAPGNELGRQKAAVDQKRAHLKAYHKEMEAWLNSLL